MIYIQERGHVEKLTRKQDMKLSPRKGRQLVPRGGNTGDTVCVGYCRARHYKDYFIRVFPEMRSQECVSEISFYFTKRLSGVFKMRCLLNASHG